MGNIRRNACFFKELTKTKLCAVVKADAYGHGAEEVAYALADIVDGFAVATIEEGTAIRQSACGKDILVFTPPLTREEAYLMAQNGFIVSVPNLFTANLLIEVTKEYRLPIRVHLKVNTGMNRYGMNPSMLGKVCNRLKGQDNIFVEGVYSHLYSTDRDRAGMQRTLFLQMKGIAERYFENLCFHLSATYGATLGEDFAFDMVRVGLGLYGYAPTTLPIERAMTVKTRVLVSRKYAFGGVGYGEGEAEKGTRLAVCRVGYADGFLRKKENGLDGYEDDVNNLCMDACIRKSNKKRGAWISLLTDAEKTATVAETISYEVLCSATRRAERIYDNE